MGGEDEPRLFRFRFLVGEIQWELILYKEQLFAVGLFFKKQTLFRKEKGSCVCARFEVLLIKKGAAVLVEIATKRHFSSITQKVSLNVRSPRLRSITHNLHP